MFSIKIRSPLTLALLLSKNLLKGCTDGNLVDMRKRTRRVIYKIGQRFHSFIVINVAPDIVSKCGHVRTAWECLCDCGKKFIVTTKKIQQGTRKSCGCLSTSSWYKKMSSEEVVAGSKYNHYQASARRRKITWNLNKKEFLDLIFKKCNYCGSEPSLETKASIHTAKINGVDRVDSNGPYSLDNCVTCCRQCNCAKGSMSLEDFLGWIDRLKKYENCSNIRHSLSS